MNEPKYTVDIYKQDADETVDDPVHSWDRPGNRDQSIASASWVANRLNLYPYKAVLKCLDSDEKIIIKMP